MSTKGLTMFRAILKNLSHVFNVVLEYLAPEVFGGWAFKHDRETSETEWTKVVRRDGYVAQVTLGFDVVSSVQANAQVNYLRIEARSIERGYLLETFQTSVKWTPFDVPSARILNAQLAALLTAMDIRIQQNASSDARQNTRQLRRVA